MGEIKAGDQGFRCTHLLIVPVVINSFLYQSLRVGLSIGRCGLSISMLNRSRHEIILLLIINLLLLYINLAITVSIPKQLRLNQTVSRAAPLQAVMTIEPDLLLGALHQY